MCNFSIERIASLLFHHLESYKTYELGQKKTKKHSVLCSSLQVFIKYFWPHKNVTHFTRAALLNSYRSQCNYSLLAFTEVPKYQIQSISVLRFSNCFMCIGKKAGGCADEANLTGAPRIASASHGAEPNNYAVACLLCIPSHVQGWRIGIPLEAVLVLVYGNTMLYSSSGVGMCSFLIKGHYGILEFSSPS
jgi:hypothetical protein